MQKIQKNIQETQGSLVNYIDCLVDKNVIIICSKITKYVKIIIFDKYSKFQYVLPAQLNINDNFYFKANNLEYYSSGFELQIIDIDNNNILYETKFELYKTKKNINISDFNRISRLNDLYDDIEELGLLKRIGYCDNYCNQINYDYIHKWSRLLKIIRNLKLFKKDIKFLEIGGGFISYSIYFIK